MESVATMLGSKPNLTCQRIVHCSMLAEDAIKSAVKDYRSKSQRAAPTIGESAPPSTSTQPVSS